MDQYCFFLAAGGTGGHVFPAVALAEELRKRGHDPHLVTDKRAERYADSFPDGHVHVVPSATIGSKNPIAIIKAGYTLFKGSRVARDLFSEYRPAAVVGFGGYPSVPPIYAASSAGIPTMLHEQNAVMGRANKMLASRVNAIAGGFLARGDNPFSSKIYETGNPVRPAVLEAAAVAYRQRQPRDPFHLLIFGGSQGAHFFAHAVPDALEALDDDLRPLFRVTQQARPEDVDDVRARFSELGVEADVSPFFSDMPRRIAEADYVVCRSGASTVSEISVIGRPAVYVPYPHALDHDQAANAALVSANGGAEVVRQSELTDTRFTELLTEAVNDADKMQIAAAAARKAGKPDATARLADMAEALASRTAIEG
ncbi:undecaprenyldiphospho-muramoylpentapeptide beta-N-acetylglucosaminyltransferase [Martelella mediterranea]|uniref:UDP-N-acetylglucosamine--N-acetylmuramyl-(pentapeptide) pyrophosphoryl-undecaprenol N-acetylglucosamine transferase n=1 Tax=Martelella mediterranea TaxID=293089 RepID=A0A4V2V4Y1_9HYPH|nr:undecaprenyldiphospho-muramoylpentapeptide beta-N-acetylglucosaminyltransferase [Martelella mediterranea]TCT43152.1 UDP-N-acetylglucosamine-N-acetylmuramylpentapeptide N-acetylglucosamine transferase [Martelella mediterranea]